MLVSVLSFDASTRARATSEALEQYGLRPFHWIVRPYNTALRHSMRIAASMRPWRGIVPWVGISRKLGRVDLSRVPRTLAVPLLLALCALLAAGSSEFL
jgi:hypothetical protein